MSMFGNYGNWLGNIPQSIPWIIPGYAEQKNYAQQKQVFEWQKSVQETNWQREDNAVQRRVADLKGAGLSPVLAAGSAAQAGPPVSVTAPQRQPTPLIDKAVQVMAMLRQQVDISRTEAETDAIMAQAERTRVQTTIDDVLAKRQDEILESQIGLQTANASSATANAGLAAANAGLARTRRLTEEHNLKLSQDAGTATNPSWMSDVYRSITGQLNTPATSRVQQGINRAAQSVRMSLGRQIITNDNELRQAREVLQQMLNRRLPYEQRRDLEDRIMEYENRRQRRK